MWNKIWLIIIVEFLFEKETSHNISKKKVPNNKFPLTMVEELIFLFNVIKSNFPLSSRHHVWYSSLVVSVVTQGAWRACWSSQWSWHMGFGGGGELEWRMDSLTRWRNEDIRQVPSDISVDGKHVYKYIIRKLNSFCT